MTTMLPSTILWFKMLSCLTTSASASQWEFIFWPSLDPQSIQDLCWDSFSARPISLTIISVISFHSWRYPVPAPMSMNYWLYSWVHLTFWLLLWLFLLPTSSSFPASSKSTPWRAGPKPSAPAVPTSPLLLFSMDLQHSCTCSHHLWTPWTKGLCVLYLHCAHAKSFNLQFAE